MFLTDQSLEVFEYWKEVTKHTRSKLDAKRRKVITDRLKDGYTVDDLKLASFGCAHSPFHQGQNDRHEIYDSVELIYRNADMVDKFIRLGEQEQRRINNIKQILAPDVAKSSRGSGYIEARNRLMRIVGDE